MNPPWFGSALRQCIQDTSGKLQRIREQLNSQPLSTTLVNQTLNSSSNNNGKRKIDDDDEVLTSLASISKKSKTQPLSTTLVNQTLNSSSNNNNNGKGKIDDDEVLTSLASISKKSKTQPLSTTLVNQTLNSSSNNNNNNGKGKIDDDEVLTSLASIRKKSKTQPLSTTLVNRTLNSSSNNNNNGKGKIDDDEVLTLLASTSKKSKTLGSSVQLLEYMGAYLTPVNRGGEVNGLKLVKPGFDLTNSMLINRIGSQTDNEKSKVADLLKKGDKSVKAKEKAEVKAQKSSDETGDGPRFEDLGGIDDLLDELKRRVVIPLQCPQLPWGLGAKPISGILLHGPSGCGKTTLARAIANETRVPFYSVTGTSEENIRELFSKAYETAPSIVFIDKVDAIGLNRDTSKRRILMQLMTCMDESHKIAKPDAASKNEVTPDGKRGYVLVIGATNSPDDLDPALRRRFEREYTLGVQDEIARTKILSVLTQNLKHKGALDLVKVARSTGGFVGVDLVNLVTEASNLAVDRVIHRRELEHFKEKAHTKQNEDGWWNAWTSEEMEKDSVTMSDFEMARKRVQPSSKREGFSSIPNVTWEDVGGYDELREEFYLHIVSRIECPDEYEENGLDLETGFLLYGPPGCGKTLIAKAIANEAGANFIYIKGPELLDKYVGESEKAVRTLFSRARTCKPCILFFDEIDSLTRKRGGREGGTLVVERVLNQLLIELDGADERKGVYVIGATNRPEVMDPAVVRPGRLGKRLYVPLPNADQRGLILKSLARTKRLDADVDLIAIGKSDACDKFSGADLRALINEANLAAFKEKKKSPTANANEGTSVSSAESSLRGIPYMIKAKHIDQALEKISPSVSDENIQFYKGLQKIFN